MRTRKLAHRVSLRVQALDERCQPAAGILDPLFDADGIAIVNVASQGGAAFDVLIQPDGKIVATGQSNSTLSGNGGDFVVTRYRADGSLDTSFGTAGIATIDVQRQNNAGWAGALQSDGKILIGGFSQTTKGGSYEWNVTLIRLNSNGTLDTSFGGKSAKGIVITDVVSSNTQEWIRDLAIQPDGKIVAVGETNSRTFVLRYKSDGTLDPTFDGDGRVVFDLNGAVGTQALAVGLQPDGKILVGGSETVPGTMYARLMRLNANGSLDTTFGTGGRVLDNRLGHNIVYSVVVQTDGKLVTAGGRPAGQDGEAVIGRFSSNGAPDTGFGDDIDGDSVRDGITVPALPGGNVVGYLGAVVDGNGRIDFVGRRFSPDSVVPTAPEDRDFAIVRLNSDGSVDSSFGTSGVTVTDYSGTDDEWHIAVALQSDGKIVTAGKVVDPATGRERFAVARYTGDETPNTGNRPQSSTAAPLTEITPPMTGLMASSTPAVRWIANMPAKPIARRIGAPPATPLASTVGRAQPAAVIAFNLAPFTTNAGLNV